MIRVWLAAIAAMASLGAHAIPSLNLVENFDDLVASGWTIVNASNPLGFDPCWFQGNSAASFPAQSGAPNAYAAANFEATDPNGGDLSCWLISPEISLGFQQLSFWTRTADDPDFFFGDGLRVLLSTSGASLSLADFTTVLVEINTANASGAYPQAWTQFFAAIAASGTGRIAFQYTVGPNALANYIGVDTVVVRAVPEPSSLALVAAGIALLIGMRTYRVGRHRRDAPYNRRAGSRRAWLHRFSPTSIPNSSPPSRCRTPRR